MPPTNPSTRALEQARARLDEALEGKPHDVRLLKLRGRADERLGRYAEAAAFFQRAAKQSRLAGERGHEAAALLDAATALSRAGAVADARNCFHRVISSYELQRDEGALVGARMDLARHELSRREFGAARQQLDRCVEPLAALGRWEDVLWVHDRLIEIGRQDGDLGAAMVQARASVEAAAKAKDRAQFGLRLAGVGELHREMGNAKKARSYMKKALPYLREAVNVSALLQVLLALSELSGSQEAATKLLEEALVVADGSGKPGPRGRVRVRLAEHLSGTDTTRARVLLEHAVRHLREAGNPKRSGPAWWTLAVLQHGQGDEDAASGSLERAAALFDMVGDRDRADEAAAARAALAEGRWSP